MGGSNGCVTGTFCRSLVALAGIVKAKDDETPLSVAERARRNLEADVELFIDVLCGTGLQPVFSEDDREQVIAVYGPVHARLLRQSLELISDAGEVKKK